MLRRALPTLRSLEDSERRSAGGNRSEQAFSLSQALLTGLATGLTPAWLCRAGGLYSSPVDPCFAAARLSVAGEELWVGLGDGGVGGQAGSGATTVENRLFRRRGTLHLSCPISKFVRKLFFSCVWKSAESTQPFFLSFPPSLPLLLPRLKV